MLELEESNGTGTMIQFFLPMGPRPLATSLRVQW